MELPDLRTQSIKSSKGGDRVELCAAILFIHPIFIRLQTLAFTFLFAYFCQINATEGSLGTEGYPAIEGLFS